MTRLRAFLAELNRPERFTGYAGATNQFGHAGVGLAVAAAVQRLDTADALAAVALASLVYLCAWEAPRLARALGRRGRKLLRDSLADTAFVAAGGVAGVTLGLWGVAVVGALALAFGVWTTRA